MGRRATPEKPYIIGLTRFGAILSQLQVCVYADDPYADWWLVKVEEALARSAQEVKVLRHWVEDQLKSTPAIEVKLAASLQPVRVPLQFRNPFAYSAARILADVDTLVRAVLTARHIGLMDRREAERCLVLGTRALRRAMGGARVQVRGREAPRPPRGQRQGAAGSGAHGRGTPRDPRRQPAGTICAREALHQTNERRVRLHASRRTG